MPDPTMVMLERLQAKLDLAAHKGHLAIQLDIEHAQRAYELLSTGNGGALMIAAERRRQVEEEGFTQEHDDEEHGPGDLARQAEAILFALVNGEESGVVDDWGLVLKHRGQENGDLKLLVIAGALVAAAIDSHVRLGRAGAV
jgi:hypothetical protein